MEEFALLALDSIRLNTWRESLNMIGGEETPQGGGVWPALLELW
jgi:hypothetical protein